MAFPPRALGAAWLLGACASVPGSSLPDPDLDPGLGDVVLMKWTTRSSEGLLGCALDRDPDHTEVDRIRRLVVGTPRWVPTDQRLTFVVSAESGASASVGQGALSAGAGASRATHVAYDVQVAGYLELAPDTVKYEAKSNCCQAGRPIDACADGYVGRLIWGSGRAQYLVRVEANVQVAAADLVRASGGTRFRRVNQMRFRDTFFAYEVVPTAAVCRYVSPADELEPMTVTAPNTCWVQVFGTDGTRHSGSFKLPDAELCRKTARHFCDRVEGHLDCQATFGSGRKVEHLDLEVPQAPVDEPGPVRLEPEGPRSTL